MANSQHKIRHITLLFLLGITSCALAYETYGWISNSRRVPKEIAPPTVNINEIIADNNTDTLSSTNTPITETTATPEVKPLPISLNLEVPFYTQAPFSNWDYPWQEACEEASALLVANTYLNHNWTKEQFNQQILSLVDWEKKTFGDYKHTDVRQTEQILNEYLGLKTIIHETPTYDDVKEILSKGHLIIMTFGGKHLNNPNYKNGGPNYHAMVIKGYNDVGQKIITNDVGTRNGENYVYTWTTINNSLHDYDEPIESGAKRIIEVLPPEKPTAN